MKRGLVLVLGGIRSGKSRYAQSLAAQASAVGLPVTFIATGLAADEEMQRRIARHRLERPDGWQTVEEPRRPARVLEELVPPHAVVLDDLGFLVSNHLLSDFAGDGEPPTVCERADDSLAEELGALVGAARRRRHLLVVVSNEVGLGTVPLTSVGRRFCDLLGWSNQRLAREADRVVFLVAGIPLTLKDSGDETGG